MYVSENLAGEVTQVVDVATADEFLTIEGVTFTAKAAPSGAGQFDVAGSVAAQGQIMVNMINGTGTPGETSYIALSEADRNTLTNAQITASYDAATGTLTITGSGRLTYSTDLSGTTTEWLNCYFGKKGAIDLVVQDMKEVDMRETADRRGTNVFSSYLAGIKTFTDGSKKFLRVKIAV